MKLIKFIKIIFFITFLAVVYTYLQMQIIDFAYQEKRKEQQVRKLIEVNGNITHAILNMKSASNIGGKVLTEESKLHFVDPNNIIKIITPRGVEKFKESRAQTPEIRMGKWLSFLPFGSEAEAKPR
ncbi:MAG: hypothetical protein H6755_05235 [Candidatus Omnitrophica bacterium]|nr:hypothetical protein [Candidatus Omnitrophota bacterium]MCB9747795.1 hypothetical protein [Candidatus Omnitrophota bacterium]